MPVLLASSLIPWRRLPTAVTDVDVTRDVVLTLDPICNRWRVAEAEQLAGRHFPEQSARVSEVGDNKPPSHHLFSPPKASHPAAWFVPEPPFPVGNLELCAPQPEVYWLTQLFFCCVGKRRIYSENEEVRLKIAIWYPNNYGIASIIIDKASPKDW